MNKVQGRASLLSFTFGSDQKPVTRQSNTKPTNMMAPSKRVDLCGNLFVPLHQTEPLGVLEVVSNRVVFCSFPVKYPEGLEKSVTGDKAQFTTNLIGEVRSRYTMGIHPRRCTLAKSDKGMHLDLSSTVLF